MPNPLRDSKEQNRQFFVVNFEGDPECRIRFGILARIIHDAGHERTVEARGPLASPR
jgi:hypothetical protein